MNRIRNWALRARIIVTGRTEWADPDTGEVDVLHDRSIAWVVAKPRWSTSRFVRKFGAMPCGCTRSPLTRRRVLTVGTCSEHGPLRSDEDR